MLNFPSDDHYFDVTDCITIGYCKSRSLNVKYPVQECRLPNLAQCTHVAVDVNVKSSYFFGTYFNNFFLLHYKGIEKVCIFFFFLLVFTSSFHNYRRITNHKNYHILSTRLMGTSLASSSFYFIYLDGQKPSKILYKYFTVRPGTKWSLRFRS
jgi:hypothetical protein